MKTTTNPDDIRERTGIQLELSKNAVNQSKSGGMTIKFEVDPAEVPSDLLAAPLNTRYMAVLVEIAEHGEMVVPRSVEEGELAVKRAVMLCTDEEFQSFMNCDTPEDAAIGLRKLLNISSRADLKDDERAQKKFDELRNDFLAWRKGGKPVW